MHALNDSYNKNYNKIVSQQWYLNILVFTVVKITFVKKDAPLAAQQKIM